MAAARTPSRNVFDNDTVCALLRRLNNKAFLVLRHLQRVTQQKAEQAGQAWDRLWEAALPSIRYYNTQLQDAMAAQLAAEVPDVDAGLIAAYKQYCALHLGTTSDGRINMMDVDPPPLRDFYHAFLVRLSENRVVINRDMFQPAAHAAFDTACANAFLDALRDVLLHRVTVTAVLTRQSSARD